MRALTVLYDQDCGLCRRAHSWLAEQAKLIELQFVPCASEQARQRYPQLNHGDSSPADGRDESPCAFALETQNNNAAKTGTNFMWAMHNISGKSLLPDRC